MINSLENYEKKYLFLIDIAVMIFLFILLYNSQVNNKLIIGLEISLFSTMVMVYINILFNISSMMFIDIRLSLILGYCFYNLYTPVIYCFRSNEILDYGINEIGWLFYAKDVQKALFVSILFLAGLLLALTLSRKYEGNSEGEDTAVMKANKMNFNFWLMLFIISFLWYLYPYIKTGPDFLNYDRWYRYTFLFNDIKEQLGIVNKIMNVLSSNYLILISLFMMFRNSINSKSKLQRAVFAVSIIIYSVFILFIDLRRRELLMIILMCVSYYFFHIKFSFSTIKIKRSLKKISVSLVILLIFFMVYQSYRQFFKYGYTGGISAVTDMKSQSADESDAYTSEFGMVYLTNLSSVEYTPELLYGKSYFEAFLRPIPFISNITNEWFGYDKDKDSIELWMSTIYTDLFEAGGGLGFSPSSEAFINFGYLGCPITGLIIGLFINFLYKKLFNERHIVIYCIIFSLAFIFSRTNLYGSTFEFFWLAFNYIFYSSILGIMKNIK